MGEDTQAASETNDGSSVWSFILNRFVLKRIVIPPKPACRDEQITLNGGRKRAARFANRMQDLVPTFYLFCARIFRFRVQKPRVVKRSYVAAIFVAKRVYSLSLVFSYVPRRRVAAYNAVFLF